MPSETFIVYSILHRWPNITIIIFLNLVGAETNRTTDMIILSQGDPGAKFQTLESGY